MGLDSFAHITYLFIFPWMSLEPLEGGVWTMKWVHSTHGCSLWKGNRAAWDDLINYVCFGMGIGDSVCFFGMVGGVGSAALFLLAIDLDGLISDYLVGGTGGSEKPWNVRFV